MLFIPLNVNWYRMPFSRAVDLDPHESTFIFPPPFHFMTCHDGEFYGEKEEQLKTNIQHKINIKNWQFSLRDDPPHFAQWSNAERHLRHTGCA